MRQLFFLISTLLFVLGCGHGSTEPDINDNYVSSSDISISSSENVSSFELTSSSSNVSSPISLFKLGTLNKQINSVESMDSMGFDIELDTILTTTSYYFILRNTSESDIHGLQFEFDVPYFTITPDTMVTLGSPVTSTGMDQLIKVTIEHGTLASGLGFTDVLTGNQFGNLTISGTNDDGDFSITYTMHAFAKRMVLMIDTVQSVLMYDADSSTYNFAYNITYSYFHVDPFSRDCYVDFFSDNVVVDSTYNKIIIGEDNIFDLNGVVIDSTLYTAYMNEKNAYNMFSANHDYNINCVVLVVNNVTGTTQILN